MKTWCTISAFQQAWWVLITWLEPWNLDTCLHALHYQRFVSEFCPVLAKLIINSTSASLGSAWWELSLRVKTCLLSQPDQHSEGSRTIRCGPLPQTVSVFLTVRVTSAMNCPTRSQKIPQIWETMNRILYLNNIQCTQSMQSHICKRIRGLIGLNQCHLWLGCHWNMSRAATTCQYTLKGYTTQVICFYQRAPVSQGTAWFFPTTMVTASKVVTHNVPGIVGPSRDCEKKIPKKKPKANKGYFDDSFLSNDMFVVVDVPVCNLLLQLACPAESKVYRPTSLTF